MTDIWAACGAQAQPSAADGGDSAAGREPGAGGHQPARRHARRTGSSRVDARSEQARAATRCGAGSTTCSRPRFDIRRCRTVRVSAAVTSRVSSMPRGQRAPSWRNRPTTASSSGRECAGRRQRRCGLNTRSSVRSCAHAAAMRCTNPRSIEFHATLASRDDYAPTQALGRHLRDAGADAIEYVSARDADGGLNVALYTPSAFGQARPTFKEEWLCETHARRGEFLRARWRRPARVSAVAVHDRGSAAGAGGVNQRRPRTGCERERSCRRRISVDSRDDQRSAREPSAAKHLACPIFRQ